MHRIFEVVMRKKAMGRDGRILMLGSVAALLLLATGALWLSRPVADPFAPCRQTPSTGAMADMGTAFTLTDQTGARVSDTKVFDTPSLLYFGYTYCPDICPMDMARNAQAVTILDEQGVTTTPVMITVDPARDTPQVLAEFAQMMHPRMIGLTGSTAEIDAVSKAWRNYFRLNNQNDAENYLVDHMTNTYLVLPKAGTVAVFPRDMAPQEMAERTACYIAAVDKAGL